MSMLAATLAVAVIVASPSLGGGLLAFADNPPHLAEIRDLASAGNTGWSSLAYCGFPLHTLQSPLTFGVLAWLHRSGVSLEVTYQLVSILSFAAPALAFGYVARRHLATPWAFLLASTLLFYRGSLAALHGMFSFGLASAAWLLVLGMLTQERRSLRYFATLAAFAAFIGLTHMYVTIALVYLGVVHALWSSFDGAGRRRLYWDLPALGLGAFAASAYWLANALSKTPAVGKPDQLLRILSRLLTVSDPAPQVPIHGLPRLKFDPIWFADVPLQLVVVAAAVAGALLAFRSEQRLPRYGAVLGLVWLTLLILQPWLPVLLLGPQNERFVLFVKYASLVAAIPAVAWVQSRVRSPRRAWSFAVGIALLGTLLSQRLVARQVIPEAELAELSRFWQRLAEEKKPTWGRVLLQDTSSTELGTGLDRSHIMAETAQRAGVEQIGGFYANTPYDRAEFWLSFLSTDPRFPDRTLGVMERANATHLALTDPALSRRFAADARFERVLQEGRFTLFARRGFESRWAVTDDGARVAVKRVRPGEIELKSDALASPITLNESYHPFWSVDPPGAARLERAELGMLRAVPSMPQASLHLRYTPPQLPNWLSLFGLSIIALVFLLDLSLKRAPARH